MSYSRRQLEAFGEPLGESVTREKPGGNGRIYGGGGGGPTSSTVTQTNIPEYAKPYVEAMLGASLQEAFDIKKTGTGDKATYDIVGVKPYQPYSLDPNDYFAGFSPLQQAAFMGAGQLQVPGQIGQASDITAQLAQAAPEAGAMGMEYGQQAADIGGLGVLGAAQGFGTGQQYFQQVMDPSRIGSLMSPYMQNVVDRQMESARRQADITRQQRNAQLARAGAFGGSRQAIEESEAQKALGSQLQDIQTRGLQSAYEQALQQQQLGTQFGLQGLGAGYQGLGVGLSGQQAAMQGVGLGLQGLGQAGQMAGQLGGLGAQQLGASQGILGMQQQYGAMQQAQEQQIINQAIQNYAMAQQYPQQQLGFLNAMIRGMATPTTTTQSYQAAPSLTSQVAGLGTAGIAGLGLYNAMNK